ncbi:MAG: glycosyltransferase family 87 protein [Vicinamibacterales bacterium]
MLHPFLAVHAIFPAMWLIAVARNGPAPNDWLHLKVVADHFMAGDWTRLYAIGDQALNPGYFWRYPPFALYVVAPLAWLPEAWAYALLAGVEVAALAASLWLLRRLEPFRHRRREWLLAIALSASALATIVTGQSSALMLLCVVAAATLWTRGQVIHACALLGLLAIKPNWGIVFGLLAIVRGEWKGAATMAGVVVLLCVLTLPLGFQVWADFVSTSMANTDILANYAPQKLITLRGFLEWMLGKGSLTLTLWAFAAAGLVVTAALAWRAPGPPLRHLGIGLLLAVAANPYASFYDALVLAVPATVWWAERDRWTRGPWLVVGTLLALAWCIEQALYSWGVLAATAGLEWLPPVSVVGPVAAVWLVLAARQAMQPPGLHPNGAV